MVVTRYYEELAQRGEKLLKDGGWKRTGKVDFTVNDKRKSENAGMTLFSDKSFCSKIFSLLRVLISLPSNQKEDLRRCRHLACLDLAPEQSETEKAYDPKQPQRRSPLLPRPDGARVQRAHRGHLPAPPRRGSRVDQVPPLGQARAPRHRHSREAHEQIRKEAAEEPGGRGAQERLWRAEAAGQREEGAGGDPSASRRRGDHSGKVRSHSTQGT